MLDFHFTLCMACLLIKKRKIMFEHELHQHAIKKKRILINIQHHTAVFDVYLTQSNVTASSYV